MSSNYKIPYDYVNDLECFETLIALIDQFIEQSGIERSNIIKACMTVGGRVNPYEGKAHNYFTCLDNTLACWAEYIRGKNTFCSYSTWLLWPDT